MTDCRLRSVANVGTMSGMNLYETPQTVDDQILPADGRQKRIIAWALIFALGLVVGGMVTFFRVRIQATRAGQAELMRARQAAEAADLRAREAVLNAEEKQNSSAP